MVPLKAIAQTQGQHKACIKAMELVHLIQTFARR